MTRSEGLLQKKSRALIKAHAQFEISGIPCEYGSCTGLFDGELLPCGFIYFIPTSLDQLAIAEEIAVKNMLRAGIAKLYKLDGTTAITIEIR